MDDREWSFGEAADAGAAVCRVAFEPCACTLTCSATFRQAMALPLLACPLHRSPAGAVAQGVYSYDAEMREDVAWHPLWTASEGFVTEEMQTWLADRERGPGPHAA